MRQDLFGIRTEADRPKFLAGLRLWTGELLSAVGGTPMAAFETLANARSEVVCCVK